MPVDILALSEGLQDLPLPQLIAVATGVVLLAALVMRVLTNKFNGKAPPIDEGIPFVGGLIKFSKVSLIFCSSCFCSRPSHSPTPSSPVPSITCIKSGTS